MIGASLRDEQWERQFEKWLEPFLEALGRKQRRRWAPLYVRGLLGPGDRKSIEPIAARVAPSELQQLHHFVSASAWETGPVEEVLLAKADALVGGQDAHLIVDDTAIPKKGERSVGVTHQYCGAVGKQMNCQALVSLTLACDEMPVPIALRLYLPQAWAADPVRRKECRVPDSVVFKPKWAIALDEIERVLRAGVTFGAVLADAGYGMYHEFRHGLSARGLTWAVGILPNQLVYPKSVRTSLPANARSRLQTSMPARKGS
jgi:SRSO17 transposase